MFRLGMIRRANERQYNDQLNFIKENNKPVITLGNGISPEEFKKKKEEKRQRILNNYNKKVMEDFEKEKNKNTGYDNSNNNNIISGKLDLQTKLKILEQLRK